MISSSSSSTNPRANLLGSLFMVLAMGLFGFEDAFIKLMTEQLPVGETLLLFGLGGALGFAVLATLQGERLLDRNVLSRAMQVRFVFEFTGRLFYAIALALTPLSSVTAILQAAPIVVVVGAAFFFGERVGWRRWMAITIGMCGVLVIVQPGAESFSPLSILPVIAMVGFAGRDLASRAASASLSGSVLGFYGFLTLVIAGISYGLWDKEPLLMPSLQSWAALAGAVGCGIVAYSALMKAMSTGEVSAVTPFRYTRLLFGIGLGLVFFGETLTPSMIIGCLMIVISGLFVMWRGRKLQREEEQVDAVGP